MCESCDEHSGETRATHPIFGTLWFCPVCLADALAVGWLIN